MDRGGIKVSVVIATYRSGAALTERVMRSLDAQTLPTDEWEVLLVDDGSGDGTVDLLHQLAAERPHVRVHEIEHSGWPSRPRNTGIDLARGTYVCFMDHDDALYPEALELATAYALEHGLDVLNPKEVRVRPQASWNWMRYDEDVVADAASTRAELMVPSRPHKLYRTAFLREHDIRFPDGADVHWEDRYFNARCLTSLEAFGVLASEPFYQWIDTGQNSSRAYEGDPADWDLAVYWASLKELFDFLASVHSERDLAELRQREFVNRVLPWAGPRRLFDQDPDLVQRSYDLMAPYLAAHCPPELDATLSPVRRARASLLRARDLPRLRQLAAVDAEAGMHIRLGAVRIEPDGTIVVAAYARLLHRGEPMLFEQTPAGRLRRPLPDDLAAALPEDVLDVTDAIGDVACTIAVRNLAGHDVYPQHQTSTEAVRRPQEGGGTAVRFDFRAVIDPATARLGKPLADGTWEIGADCELIGYERARGIVMPASVRRASGRLVAGRVVVLRPDEEKRLLLDLGSSVALWDAAGAADLGPEAIRLDRPLRPRALLVALPELPAGGAGSTPCEVLLRATDGTALTLAAELEADRGGAARIRAAWQPVAAGQYDVALRHADHEITLGPRLVVPRLGPARAVARADS